MSLLSIATALLLAFFAFALLVVGIYYIARCVTWWEWTYMARPEGCGGSVYCDNVPIPAVIYRTGKHAYHSLDDRVKQLYADTEAQNPGYTTRYFDDAQCAAHIGTYFGPRVLASFHCLKPGAYKADLARLCLIHTFGGVYADFATEFVAPIDDAFVNRATDELVLVHDHPAFIWLGLRRGIFNAVFAARSNHVFLKRCIDAIVKNVENRYYGVTFLDPTGPGMMWPVYAGLVREFPDMPRRITSCNLWKHSIHDVRSRKRIINGKIKSLRSTLGGNSYFDMWHKRDIYAATSA